MKKPQSRSLIVFAGALYDAPLWTNRQHVAQRMAQHGWRVLYVEPRLFFLRQLFGRFNGGRGRLRWFFRHFVPWQAEKNLWVISQVNLIPGSRRWPWLGRLNHRLFNASAVRVHRRWLLHRDPVLLIYDTEAAEFLEDFHHSRVVYDCVDDHHTQAGVDRNPALVLQEEETLVSRASAIAVTTPPLFERFSRVHANVHLVPNAADVEAFSTTPAPEPEDMTSIPHPRIGTVGALDEYKIDVPLLAAVIEQHSDWQFVLVGPMEYVGRQQGTGNRDSMGSLRRFSNVHFFGPKPRTGIPAYVQAFDVAIIPYRMSSYNRASFPLKFWELLAAGKPVVASGLPSLEPYRHLVTLADTPKSFGDCIARALTAPEQGRSERVAEARAHDWSTRVAALEQLLQGGVR